MKMNKNSLWKNNIYTPLTNFNIKCLMVCNVYTDVGGIK